MNETAAPSDPTGQPIGLLSPRDLGFGCLLAVLVFIAYFPTLKAGYVWDDSLYVGANQNLRTVEGLKAIWVDPTKSTQYYPVLFTFFWAEYQLWELNAFGYHLVNVIFQACNGILLWILLRQLRVPGAWLTAAVFAIHPIQVESVAWISQLKNLLSAFFVFLSLLAWQSFTARSEWRPYLLSLFLFTCALLSKTAVCPIPFVLILLLWWKRSPLDLKKLLTTVPFFFASLVLGLVHVWREQFNIGDASEKVDLSAPERMIAAGRSFWFYIEKILWPTDLMTIYPRWEIDASAPSQYLYPVMAVLFLVGLFLLHKKIGKGPFVGFASFTVVVAPALNFVSQAFTRLSYVADHFQYLACVGVIAVLVAGLANLFKVKGRGAAAAYGGLSALLVIVLTGLSFAQSPHYQNIETLFKHNMELNPAASVPLSNVAASKAIMGLFEEAIPLYETALEITRDDAMLYRQLALAQASVGRNEQALENYRESIRLDPEDASTHYYLAGLLVEKGQLAEGVEHYREAIRLDPNWPKPVYQLSLLLASTGEETIHDPEEAVRLARIGCELTQYSDPIYVGALAVAIAETGNGEEAMAVGKKAIGLARSAGQDQLAETIRIRVGESLKKAQTPKGEE
jgi:tetratricopeptide (TPR) repeat protein